MHSHAARPEQLFSPVQHVPARILLGSCRTVSWKCRQELTLTALIESYYGSKLFGWGFGKGCSQTADWWKRRWLNGSRKEALKATKQNMAVCAKFNELGLSFTWTGTDDLPDSGWVLLWAGREKTWKRTEFPKTPLSFSPDHLHEGQVFDAIYGEGGEKEVSEQELRDYYENNYIKMAVQTALASQQSQRWRKTQPRKKKCTMSSIRVERSNVYTNAESLYTQEPDWSGTGQILERGPQPVQTG